MTLEAVISLEELGVFIKWHNQEGLARTSLGDSLERLKEKPQKVMNITNVVIQVITHKISKALDTIEDVVRPDQDVEFSLNLDLEGNSVIPMVAKTTAGSQFNINCSGHWENPRLPTVFVNENK